LIKWVVLIDLVFIDIIGQIGCETM